MNNCVIDNDLKCRVCGRRAFSRNVRRNCEAFPRPNINSESLDLYSDHTKDFHQVQQCAPGDELAAILRDWLGIEAEAGCGCKSMQVRMNALGPDWCESEAGLAEILGVMRTEHAKRWADGQTRLPWSDYAATQLVRLACRRARAKAEPAD